VRKLPDGSEVGFDTSGDGNQITLKAGRSRFALSTLPKEDFPAMGSGEMATRFELSAADLRRLIDRTRFAISTEETRYYLNGIYFHAAGSAKLPVLRAVATDGHRLARVEMALPEGAATMPGIIVPRKTVNELRKLIDESANSVTVELSETKARFAFDDVNLTSKLIDGTFPDYERVIPTGNDKVMRVDRKAFAEAVDRVSTISTEKSRAVKLSLGQGSLTLFATSPENGTASEEIEANYDGGAIDIGFNSRYLLDITQQIEGDGAEFAISDAASPTIVRDEADQTALYVLMPMRV
jgi:DNA polymerase III subunit beta